MSPYLFLYVFIATFACISWRLKKNIINIVYYFTMLILFIFLVMRYGQGSDYFAYEYMFNYWRNIYNIDEFLFKLNNIHGEYIWSAFGYIFNKILHLNFEYFIGILAVVEFYELHLYFNHYCKKNKIWCILLVFPTLYLTYMFSALRQGLVICTFLAIMLRLLEKGELLKYYVYVFILMFIHSSAVILFLIPIIIMLKIETLRVILLLSVILGITLGSSLSDIMSIIFPIRNIVARMGGYHIFLPAIGERLLMFILVSYLYYKKSIANHSVDKLLYKVYIYSLIIYFLFIGYSLVASRLSIAPKMVEFILIVHFIDKLPKLRIAICFIILILNTLMYCKNIDSYIEQRKYNNTNIFNYPYITIFNKDLITEYITIPTYGYRD